MVKTYLKYVLKDSYGVISTTNAVFDAGERAAVTGALECPAAWDFKRSELTWASRDHEDSKTEITVVSILYPTGRTVATGHSDGTVRLWNRSSRGPNAQKKGVRRIPDRSSREWDLMDDMEYEEAEDALLEEAPVTLSGHRSAVTALAFGNGGAMLASGARDTDIVVWDVTGERGLFRLRGHTGPITALCWLEKARAIVSCSKDTLVKVWSVDNQQCLQTVVGHRSEVLCAAVALNDQSTLFTGAADGKVRVWSVDAEKSIAAVEETKRPGDAKAEEEEGLGEVGNGGNGSSNDDSDDIVRLEGVLVPPVAMAGLDGSNGKITSMCVSDEKRVFTCVVGDKVAAFYKILSDSEVEKKKRRREQRSKSKKRQKVQENSGDNKEEDEEEEEEGKDSERVEVEDRFSYLWPMRAGGKIRSVALNKKADRALLALNNNAIELYDLFITPAQEAEGGDAGDDDEEEDGNGSAGPGKTHFALAHAVTQQGHRTDVRALALTSDSSTIVSVSNGSTKIWGLHSRVCRRTVECGYGLCAAVVPGNRHVVVGTKEGTLQVVEINSGVILEEIEAHQGAVWSVATRPDGSGIVSGSADHTVKFWDFDIRKAAGRRGGAAAGGGVLSLVETATATLEDDVLAVKMSPDGRLLAVALLDNSIKVYKCGEAGELKFFLSLYGHKLPVLTIDISSDSRLLVSGSADKNIKIWGLDFGDCHKSLFAHTDSVTQVAFVPRTHYLFSVGKDGKLKYWDADKFEQVQVLDAQRGTGAACWAVAVGAAGELVVTAGHDRSIRLWERTQEQLFLEEEKERALDAQFESAIDESEAFADRNDPSRPEAEEATRKSLATVRSGEVLLEALDLAEEEAAKAAIYAGEVAAAVAAGEEPPAAPPQKNIRLLGLEEHDYILKRLAEIPASHIEQALLILPFHHVVNFLKFADRLIEEGKRVELCAQCVFFLLRVHHAQITASVELKKVVESLMRNTRRNVSEQRDLIGFNLAAMNYMKRQLELEGEIKVFDDVEQKLADLRIAGKKGKKNNKKNGKNKDMSLKVI